MSDVVTVEPEILIELSVPLTVESAPVLMLASTPLPLTALEFAPLVAAPWSCAPVCWLVCVLDVLDAPPFPLRNARAASGPTVTGSDPSMAAGRRSIVNARFIYFFKKNRTATAPATIQGNMELLPLEAAAAVLAALDEVFPNNEPPLKIGFVVPPEAPPPALVPPPNRL